MMLIRKRIAAVLALLSPLAIYPVFLLFSIGYDIILGERLLRFALEYGSSIELLWTMLSDWGDALPASYLLSFVAGLSVYGWQRSGGRYPFTVFVALAASAGGLTAYIATGSIDHPLVWIAVLSGAAWAASLSGSLKLLSAAKQ